MTQTETTARADVDALAAKQLIFKIQDVLSLILAGAHAIAHGDLEDDQGPAAGIEAAAEDARGLLYDLMDAIGIEAAGDKIEAPTKEIEARAKELGAKPAAIHKWRKRGIPARWQLKLQP